MTTLQKLDQFLNLIEDIAAYEMGDVNIGKYVYREYLKKAEELATQFNMIMYAQQCQEKLNLPQNV